MTQPIEAVGGSNDAPVIAAEPTLEDRFAAIEEQEEEKNPEAEQAQPETDEPVLTPEDVPEVEAEAEEAPPIKPPVSWEAEKVEEFKQLPRDLQEYIVEREAHREKFVQSKAQEAATARRQVESEAVQTLTQLQNTYAQQLQSLLPPIPARPTHQQIADDPWTYGPQMDAYEQAVAQHQWAQQQLAEIASRQSHARQAQRNQELQEMESTLKDQFPEYLSPEHGPKLRQELGAVAIELGFSSEELADPTARDILAMRTVANLKAKADKYDALMAKKMETVRSAKTLPRVSKPGTASAPGAVANERYTKDRTAMKQGDSDAAARVFGRFV